MQSLTEIGNSSKSVIPHSKRPPLPNCIEPNEEIQIDIGGPIINEKGIEQYFIASIYITMEYLEQLD